MNFPAISWAISLEREHRALLQRMKELKSQADNERNAKRKELLIVQHAALESYEDALLQQIDFEGRISRRHELTESAVEELKTYSEGVCNRLAEQLPGVSVVVRGEIIIDGERHSTMEDDDDD